MHCQGKRFNFHGQAFDYVRNDDFNARDYFALVKAPYHTNQLGGALGGPIKRDKLFFFADFQYLTEHEGQTYDLNTPTAAERTGNLSALVKDGAEPITNANACQVLANANGLAGVPCTTKLAPLLPSREPTIRYLRRISIRFHQLF
jgi:hypothetical protein